MKDSWTLFLQYFFFYTLFSLLQPEKKKGLSIEKNIFKFANWKTPINDCNRIRTSLV